MRDGLRNKSVKAQMESNALKSEKVGYERTRESLSARFSCLMDGARLAALHGLPKEKEVALLIDGLKGNTFLSNEATPCKTRGVR